MAAGAHFAVSACPPLRPAVDLSLASPQAPLGEPRCHRGAGVGLADARSSLAARPRRPSLPAVVAACPSELPFGSAGGSLSVKLISPIAHQAARRCRR